MSYKRTFLLSGSLSLQLAHLLLSKGFAVANDADELAQTTRSISITPGDVYCSPVYSGAKQKAQWKRERLGRKS